MSEIATAFVRIRPDTRGFESEAAGSIRGAFSKLAGIAAAAFAVHEAVDFGKDIIEHAANVQKQIETIRDVFGEASESVLKFSEDGATGLGISAHLAESTAARFGILFRNLGISGDAAAEMTINFEKLAGSLALMRGLDPATVLRNLPLAVAGNLRSLKQLGIATDQTQLKIAAFKLGLTSSITQALTPAQRAQAIYAIATAHLGENLAQVAAHSGDVVNRTERLAAAWDNAKDRLGQGLLPLAGAFVHVIGELLPAAVAVLTTVFRDLGRDLAGIVSAVRPALQPLLSAIGDVVRALRDEGIKGAIDRIRADFASLSPAARGVVVALGLIAVAFVALFAAAAPTTTLVLAVVGVAVAFREAYDHSQRFRDVVAKIGDVVTTQVVPIFGRLRDLVAPAFAALGSAAEQAFDLIVRAVDRVSPTIRRLADAFENLSPGAKTAAAAIAGIGIVIGGIAVGPVLGIAAAIAGIALAFTALGPDRVKGITDALAGLRRPAQEVADAIRNGIGQAIDFVGNHTRAFEILGGALAGAAAGFVALRIATTAWAIATRIATAAMALFDVALTANPIGIIVVAIGALIGALVVLYTQSATVRRIMNGIFDGLVAGARAVLPVLEGIGRAVAGAVSGLASFATGTLVPIVASIARAIGPVVETLVRTLAPAVRDFARPPAAAFSLALTAVRAFVSVAVAVLRPFVAVVIAILRPFAEAVVTAFRLATGLARELWQAFGGTIIRVARIALETVVGVIRAALRIVRGIFEALEGLITGDWGKFWNGLKNVVGGAFDGLKALIRGEVRAVGAVFKAVFDELEKVALEGFEKVIAVLAKIPTKFTVLGREIGFSNPFKGVDANLKATIARLKGTATDATKEIPTAVAEAAAKANASAAKSIHNSASKAVADAAKGTADVIGDVVGQGADSAQAAAAAEKAADAAAGAVRVLNTKLQQTITEQDAGIAKARAKVKDLGRQIADAIKQEADDVRQAVQQAESNLNSISQSLSTSIGQIIDKPLQDAQDRLGRQQNQQALEALRRSVALPGGGKLSTDPQKALAQLRALAAQSGNINRNAIQSFISQYQAAVLAVRQDQATTLKATTTQRIADLTDSFNRGQISLADYKKRILGILTADHVSYKKAGALLGTAFANGFKDQVQGLFDQAAAIAATPKDRRAGITGTDIQIIRPLETLKADQKSIAALTHKKMDAQTALQNRIAKAAEKTAALQAKITSVTINTDVPGSSTDKNSGKGSKTAKDLAGTTG